MKKEKEKGLPVVLMLHVPLFTEELYHTSMAKHRNECAYLCGVPDELTEVYSPHRREQQRTDALTKEFIELVKANSGKNGVIKLILAGHTHFDWQGEIYGIPQLVTGGGVAGSARLIALSL